MKTHKPVFIIGSYRGGTSLLFRLLSESDELWSLYRESNHLWQKFSRHPKEKSDTVILEKTKEGYFRNKVTGKTAPRVDEERKVFDNHYNFSTYNIYALGYLGRLRFLREILTCFFDLLNIFNYLFKWLSVEEYRFIDKTPPNCYRVEYLQEIYPDAKFVYLIRKQEDNVASLVSAWTHKSKFKYPYRRYLTQDQPLDIRGYEGQNWKFFIPEKWQDYRNRSIEEVCTYQYEDAHAAATEAFKKLDISQWLCIEFEDLLSDTDTTMAEICEFIEIEYSGEMKSLAKKMPPVNTDIKADQ